MRRGNFYFAPCNGNTGPTLRRQGFTSRSRPSTDDLVAVQTPALLQVLRPAHMQDWERSGSLQLKSKTRRQR